jgi:hypothetical protein
MSALRMNSSLAINNFTDFMAKTTRTKRIQKRLHTHTHAHANA